MIPDQTANSNSNRVNNLLNYQMLQTRQSILGPPMIKLYNRRVVKTVQKAQTHHCHRLKSQKIIKTLIKKQKSTEIFCTPIPMKTT